MRQTISVAPRNSIVLVLDRTVGAIPETMGNGLVAATSSCVVIGTLSEHDGQTEVTLSDEGVPPGLGGRAVFAGALTTPSKVLSVCNVLDEVLIEMSVSSDLTPLQVWANDEREPDRIAIVAIRRHLPKE